MQAPKPYLQNQVVDRTKPSGCALPTPGLQNNREETWTQIIASTLPIFEVVSYSNTMWVLFLPFLSISLSFLFPLFSFFSSLFFSSFLCFSFSSFSCLFLSLYFFVSTLLSFSPSICFFYPIHKCWRQIWQPTPVLLPGKSHGQRGLVGYSPWGLEESDMTEWLHFHFSLSCTGEGNGNPLQCSCLENPRDGGAWWAAVHGVT